MDLIAIIEHEKSPVELLGIHQVIEKCHDFKNAYLEQYPNSEMKKPAWKGAYEMTKENLIKIWELEEKGEDCTAEMEGLNYYAEMNIPYAELQFHRKTIIVSPHGLHKYRNLKIPFWASFILKMNREIAKIFDSKKIVYCVDSYEETEKIYAKSLTGASIEEVIKFGNDKFGIPPKEINKAIDNFYFIDEFDLNINDLIEL